MNETFEIFKADVEEGHVESFMYMLNNLNFLYTLSWIVKKDGEVLRKFGDVDSEQLTKILTKYKNLYGRHKFE